LLSYPCLNPGYPQVIAVEASVSKQYSVRAVRCDHTAPDEAVYERLREATDPLARSWSKLEQARTIAIKLNMSKPSDRIPRYEGRRQELVDEAVARAVFRLLRERTQARIYVVDSMFERTPEDPLLALNYRSILDAFDIDFVDGHQLPFTWYEPMGGGSMFGRYELSSAIGQADAFVSVAKLKNHAFQGVTLSLKNLFGLPPMMPHGRERRYWHHIIRLSRVLPDLGRIANPCLCVIDALTGQTGREWGGDGRVCDALIAGDHPIATDAVGTWLMGFDPTTDWPHQPFVRDRSALKIASETGYGTVNLDEIDLESAVLPPLAQFRTDETDSFETVKRWRETTCEQALYYRDHQRDLTGKYAGEYIMLQDGEVIWHGKDATALRSRRDLAGQNKDSAIFLKKADPDEFEHEHFEIYEQELAFTRAALQPVASETISSLWTAWRDERRRLYQEAP
jgi:uncharacterized protein (DUF362 family)